MALVLHPSMVRVGGQVVIAGAVTSTAVIAAASLCVTVISLKLTSNAWISRGAPTSNGSPVMEIGIMPVART